MRSWGKAQSPQIHASIEILDGGGTARYRHGLHLELSQKELEGLNWEVKTYTGIQAANENVLSVQAPRVLQFATHGYFLTKSEASEPWDDPLLHSMLILAGVSKWNPDEATYYQIGQKIFDEKEACTKGLTKQELEKSRLEVADGILTAYEVTGINLHGTELVNLTACDSGLGEITSDGVAGLQQAFQLAGARSLTMSMWEVPAKETTAQIADFYDRWLCQERNGTTLSRYQAFRASQKAALERARQKMQQIPKSPLPYSAHPFFWAATVYVGDPGDLPAILPP